MATEKLKYTSVNNLTATLFPNPEEASEIRVTFQYPLTDQTKSGSKQMVSGISGSVRYSYKLGSKTISYSEDLSVPYPKTEADRSTKYDIRISLPELPSSVKEYTAKISIIPVPNEKETTSSSKKGTKKKKAGKYFSATMATKKLTIPIAHITKPVVPSVPSIVTNFDKSNTVTVEFGTGTASTTPKSIFIQARRNGNNSNLTTYQQIDHYVNVASSRSSVSWRSSIMRDGSYYEYRARACPFKVTKDSESGKIIPPSPTDAPYSDWSDWSEKVYGPPNTPSGSFSAVLVALKVSGTQTIDKYVPQVLLTDNNNNLDNIVGYEVRYADTKEKVDDETLGLATVETIDKESHPECFKNSYGSDEYKGVEFKYTFSSVESGNYYFKIRAIGLGDYTKKYSPYHPNTAQVTVGKKPLPPTTWTDKQTYSEDDTITLHWTNNSQDGSFQTNYKIEYGLYTKNDSVIGSGNKTIIGKTDYAGLSQEPSYKYVLGTLRDIIQSVSGTQDLGEYILKYKIRTAGIFVGDGTDDTYSEWSPYKQVNVYVKPTLELCDLGTYTDDDEYNDWLWDPFDFRYDNIKYAYDGRPFPGASSDDQNTVNRFPLYIAVKSGPFPQKAIEYAYSITSNGEYDIAAYDGTEKHVSAGEIIWTGYYPPSNNKWLGEEYDSNYCFVRLNAWDIELANNQTYTLQVKVTMDSGLTASLTYEFSTEFPADDFTPYATIDISNTDFTALITPNIEPLIRYEVDSEGNVNPAVPPVIEEIEDLSDYVFHVFRKNYDGTTTEIATGINSSVPTVISDPHPSLSGVSYRIVAMNKQTGQYTFTDSYGEEFDNKAIVIQWDETYNGYDLVENYFESMNVISPPDAPEKMYELTMYGQGIQGSMVVLPYNIDVTNNYDLDTEMLDYIGREHPVSYYGTKTGETLSLSTVISKDAEDLIYALRKLSIYRGDCYIREPSGTGFWAHVTANYSLNHLEPIVNVSIEATRVEGGI